jgi:hypothetical protein
MTSRLRLAALSLVAAALLVPVRPAAAQRVYARVFGHPSPVSLDSLAQSWELAAPRGAVYRALIAVLDSLKIPAGYRDSVRAVVWQEEMVAMRRLAGEAMPRVMECGSGITGPFAAFYRVRLSYAAWVDSLAPDRSRLRIGMAAGGQDVDGTAKRPVACASHGVFEQRVKDLVEAKLTR